jgi:cytochrome c peroxidase
MKNLKSVLFVLVVALSFSSCIDDDKEFVVKYYNNGELMANELNIDLEGPPSYNLEFPAYYGRVGNFNKDDATLGRVIFYDEKLSADGTVSCASCHKQELAFSDDKVVSDGIFNEVTKRNSLALGAVFNFQEYYGPNRVPFFWDNSVQTVEEQIVKTFAAKNEMGMTMSKIVEVINNNDYYKPLIYAANNRNEVITEQVAIRALAQFVNSIGSYNSKFDQALDRETNGSTLGFGFPGEALQDFAEFSASENRGKKIYMSNCASCHGEVMGAPNELQANNGLRITDGDYGIPGTQGEFKVPSLRNLSLTYPYMHDGRYATIEEVVEHYSTGLEDTPSIHPFLKENGAAKKFNFTDNEKEDLISFLKTFDDQDILTDVKFSDPFIR